MFVIKYDKLSMIKLVQSIEKYPALYDTKKHYSKDQVDTSWDKVAMAVGEKDSLCRERWHSIKSCYIRHLKFTAVNSKRRPYYLAEYLNFMLPHVSDRIKKFMSQRKFQYDRLPCYLRDEIAPQRKPVKPVPAEHVISNQEPVVVKEEIVDIEETSESGWLSGSSDEQQPSSSRGSSVKRPTPSNSGAKKKKLDLATNEDEDVTFFKTLLPEVARMSSHQKLKFKQEALSIIEDILYATDEINITD